MGEATGNHTWPHSAGGVFALVRIDADAIHILRFGGIQHADATATGHLEDDVGHVVGDLFVRNALTNGGVAKVAGVANHDLHTGINFGCAVLVTGDITVDGRNGQSADSADGVLAQQMRNLRLAIYFHLAGYRTNETTSLLLLKEKGCDIGQVFASAGIWIWHRAAINDSKHLACKVSGNLV